MSPFLEISPLARGGSSPLFVDAQEQFRRGAGVAESAVMGLEGNTEVGGEGSETVGGEARKKPFHFHHRTKHRAGKPDANPIELRSEKAVIELGSVGDEDGVADEGTQFPSNPVEFGCRRDHLISDPGELDDEGRNATPRTHEAGPFLDDATTAHSHRSDFGNTVRRGIAAGGLEIDDDILLFCIEGPPDIGQTDFESRPLQALDLDELLTPDLVPLGFDL